MVGERMDHQPKKTTQTCHKKAYYTVYYFKTKKFIKLNLKNENTVSCGFKP